MTLVKAERTLKPRKDENHFCQRSRGGMLRCQQPKEFSCRILGKTINDIILIPPRVSPSECFRFVYPEYVYVVTTARSLTTSRNVHQSTNGRKASFRNITGLCLAPVTPMQQQQQSSSFPFASATHDSIYKAHTVYSAVLNHSLTYSFNRSVRIRHIYGEWSAVGPPEGVYS